MRKATTGFTLLLLTTVFIQPAISVEPAYREIRVSADYGIMIPSGEWNDIVQTDMGFGADLGISLTRQFTAGFAFSYNDAEPSDSYDPEYFVDITGNQWALYTYEVFGEYLVTNGDMAPFVGAQMGIHFTHIDFVDWAYEVSSMGDHGLGYTLAAGVRYRMNQRLGILLRADTRQTPGLYTGWRTSVHVGLSVHL